MLHLERMLKTLFFQPKEDVLGVKLLSFTTLWSIVICFSLLKYMWILIIHEITSTK